MSSIEAMSRVAVSGIGAVSPAGWGAAPLHEAMRSGSGIPAINLNRPGRTAGLRVLRVPEPEAPLPSLRHPRLRRASPISRFAVAAALEALGDENLEASRAGARRIGVVCTLMNACVNYSNRFYGEVLADPSTASPILFPETVFNAPSSHISACIGSTAQNDTLVGDSAGFLPALDLAVLWLLEGEVDGCLVVGAEEIDWLSAEGLGFFQRHAVASEGAGAFFLELGLPSGPPPEIELATLTDPCSYGPRRSARHAVAEVRAALEADTDLAGSADDLLVDSRSGLAGFDAAEADAWSDWRPDVPRWHPLSLLGHPMGAASALQCVVAAGAVRNGLATSALVSATGLTQQAAGLRLRRHPTSPRS